MGTSILVYILVFLFSIFELLVFFRLTSSILGTSNFEAIYLLLHFYEYKKCK